MALIGMYSHPCWSCIQRYNYSGILVNLSGFTSTICFPASLSRTIVTGCRGFLNVPIDRDKQKQVKKLQQQVQKIEQLTEDDMRALVTDELVAAHRARALNPERPSIRGTSQNPDVYFAGRETVNRYYQAVPAIVQPQCVSSSADHSVSSS